MRIALTVFQTVYLPGKRMAIVRTHNSRNILEAPNKNLFIRPQPVSTVLTLTAIIYLVWSPPLNNSLLTATKECFPNPYKGKRLRVKLFVAGMTIVGFWMIDRFLFWWQPHNRAMTMDVAIGTPHKLFRGYFFQQWANFKINLVVLEFREVDKFFAGFLTLYFCTICITRFLLLDYSVGNNSTILVTDTKWPTPSWFLKTGSVI